MSKTRVYRTTDRLVYKVNEIEVEFSPLSIHQKNIVQPILNSAMKVRIVKDEKGKEQQIIDQDVAVMTKAVQLALKYSLKGIKNLFDADDEEYQLVFDYDGSLSDECVSDLMNIQEQSGMSYICGRMIGQAPPIDGLPEGVSFLEVKTQKSKKSS